MTNKPMLSVERELIEQAMLACFEAGFGITHDALRAIIDKPAEPSKFVGAAQYWSENEQALRDVCRFEGLKGLVYQVVRDRDRPAAQHHGEPVAWSYCPECGCEELHHECGEHKQCKNCHQEWFSDINYSEVVRGNLQKLKSEQPAPVATTSSLMEAAHAIPGFPGLTGTQLRQLADYLNGVNK